MECWALNPKGNYSLQEAIEDEIEDLVDAIGLASRTDINLNRALRASLQTYANRIAGVESMKIKLWIYQNCSFEKGALSASTHKFDAQTESLLDVVLHSETEVEIEAEAA